ncbi:D,D-heptose 1,7-bisphosphate phosphatase [Methylorubrum populi]
MSHRFRTDGRDESGPTPLGDGLLGAQRLDAPPGRRAVFLDRDGVLNEDLGYVGTLDRFRWMPDAIAAVALLKASGFLVFVVTNQSGIARGLFDEDAVQALHRHMQEDLRRHGAEIDAFRYCPHHPEAVIEAYRATCRCRKPAPGLIEDLVTAYTVDRAGSFLIGDSARDLAAAAAAGIPGHLYRGGSLLAFVHPLIRSAPRLPAEAER